MQEKSYLKLNDISSYKIAFHLSNYIWDIVVEWDYFLKDTVGKQFARSIDSISANIAEGFGRYNKKDKIKFYRYSFGSLKESVDWNEKAKIRKLITEEQYKHILKELNYLIKFTNEKLTI
ncbi:MAG: four helix bundle protein [Candidatus Pacebacteria bacterium]|nr:four helix bundle protein [Candidatus Paceibacterota bacterium]